MNPLLSLAGKWHSSNKDCTNGRVTPAAPLQAAAGDGKPTDPLLVLASELKAAMMAGKKSPLPERSHALPSFATFRIIWCRVVVMVLPGKSDW